MLNKLKQWLKSDKKESRGIYNVSFNEKRATSIRTDIELIEKVIIEEAIYYIKGWHNERRDKGIGAEHIKLHLEQGSEGEITLKELLNLGNSIRAYLKEFKEPFVETSGRKLYEWQDDKGTRFRMAIDKNKGEGLIPPLSPFDDVIISFYSDRNLNERMEFKNPKVKEYYENLEHKNLKSTSQAQNLTQELLANYGNINKHTNEETEYKEQNHIRRKLC